MNSKKYLAKNIGLLTLSQFGTKFLSFLLVPLYTNVLSTAEYGTYDMLNTTILLIVPIITWNISDATLRFPLDNNKHKEIFSISLKYVSIGAFIVCLFLSINYLSNILPLFKEYTFALLFMFVVTACSIVLVNFARGIEAIKHVAISGILCSAVLLSLNIILLLFLKLGLKGYFIANIAGSGCQCIYLFISLKLWRYIVPVGREKELDKDMRIYSRPLMFNSIAWWVNSSSDRYIVTWICGLAANGIYSVGYKIPSILNIFQTIFNQAWTLSAVKDFDPEDKNGFFIGMYNLYNFSIALICSILILLTKPIARLLYAKEFYAAWIYVPILLMSVLFGSLSGYLGGIFAAVKDTKVFGRTTIISAVVNTLLNIILVYFIGPIGAAIATLISYLITWVLRLIFVRKYIILSINYKRDISTYIILCLQTVALMISIENAIVLYAIEAFAVVFLITNNRDTFRKAVKEMREVVLRRRRV